MFSKSQAIYFALTSGGLWTVLRTRRPAGDRTAVYNSPARPRGGSRRQPMGAHPAAPSPRAVRAPEHTTYAAYPRQHIRAPHASHYEHTRISAPSSYIMHNQCRTFWSARHSPIRSFTSKPDVSCPRPSSLSKASWTHLGAAVAEHPLPPALTQCAMRRTRRSSHTCGRAHETITPTHGGTSKPRAASHAARWQRHPWHAIFVVVITVRVRHTHTYTPVHTRIDGASSLTHSSQLVTCGHAPPCQASHCSPSSPSSSSRSRTPQTHARRGPDKRSRTSPSSAWNTAP